MKRTLIVAILLLVIIACRAQDFSKMSPLVRDAARSHRSLVRRMPKLHTDSRILTAFVRGDGDIGDVLETSGCKVLARFGDIYIASIPLPQISRLSMDRKIMRIEANRGNTVCMDTTRYLVNALPVYPETKAVQLSHGYTGKNVIVGVQDIGFDLTHPNFWSRDMNHYRIMRMWDQLSLDTVGSSLPVGRDYIGQDNLLAIGCPRDGFQQTHGTHTLGIAAGSGYDTNYIGMAPDADICLVCNATGDDANLIDPADYYKYTYALDALGFKYIFDYADSQGKPCVINFSEGSSQDFHGYDQLYYAVLDSLTGPGHIIVSSAGNDGWRKNYIHKGAGLRIPFDVTKGENSFTITTGGPFAVEPLFTSIDVDSLLTDTVNGVAFSVEAYRSSYDSRVMCYDISIDAPMQTSLVLSGEAALELYRVSGNIISDYGDNTHSIGSPGSAPSVICVGMNGYRNFVQAMDGNRVSNGPTDGTIDQVSSIGPTLDGRVKPDVVAPGCNIISSYSSFYIEHHPTAYDVTHSDKVHFDYHGRTYAWNYNSGTSMSSPVVAGAIALWLEANPRLTPKDCLDILRHTCRQPDASLTYPNHIYGYGEIDVFRGLQEAASLYATGIEEGIAKARSVAKGVYDLQGRRMPDGVHLPKGVYIVDGHKTVVLK